MDGVTKGETTVKKYIKVMVRDKIAAADQVRYVCGNSDYALSFDFDEEWSKYEHKTACLGSRPV